MNTILAKSNLSNFIIYFNEETGKVEEIHNHFVREFVDSFGNVVLDMVSFGHQDLIKELMKRGVKLRDVVLLGSFSEENRNFSLLNMRTTDQFSFNNSFIMEEAKRKNISMADERKYFSGVVSDFILGSVREENFRAMLEKRIVNFRHLTRKNGYTKILDDNQKVR